MKFILLEVPIFPAKGRRATISLLFTGIKQGTKKRVFRGYLENQLKLLR